MAFCIEVSEGSLAILAVEGISQGDFLFANGSETTVETHLCTVGELVKNKGSETICETGLSGGAPPGLSSVGISQGDCFSDNGAEMSTGSHSCTEEGVDGVWFSPSNKIFSTVLVLVESDLENKGSEMIGKTGCLGGEPPGFSASELNGCIM